MMTRSASVAASSPRSTCRDRPDFIETSPGTGVQTRKSKAGTPVPRSDRSTPKTSNAVPNSKIEKCGTTIIATDVIMTPFWQKQWQKL